MKTIALWIALIVLSVATSLMVAFTLDKHYVWFVQESLGTTISVEAWWGISAMALFVVRLGTLEVTRDKDEGNRLYNSIAKCLAISTGALIVVATSWVIGQVLGWV